ncbi:MAG: alanine/glycine:cation symporter family protein [Propionibacteriaceae bacterium]|nr:alanine/glycine:cation symporter family protein [Propionibacteriaceae bacterium]
MDLRELLHLLDEQIAYWGDQLWTWVMIPVVAVVGLYFTIGTGWAQARLLPDMFRTLKDPTPRRGDGTTQSISSFQAFTVSAASRVGVGNIAGVGTAIVLGGPGAVFWMWVMAFIGGASSLIESTLGQVYKVRDAEGFRGGPAYYIRRGLGSRGFGVWFALILVFSFPFAFSSLQANTIVSTISSTLGEEAPSTMVSWVVAVVVTVLTAVVIFGGIRRIATVTGKLVPVMAVLYLLIGIVIVAINWRAVPGMLFHIVADAFTVNAATGGAVGTVILAGVKRGMFSNEAGLGSAPNAGASAAVTHPVKQGLVQTLGVYFDTMLVCSITAFIVLSSQPDLAGAKKGVYLTYQAVTGPLGAWAGVLLAVIIFMLAFSSIIGNYYYGESNVEFINPSPKLLFAYRVLATLAIFGGSLAAASLVWTIADAVMAFMALTNLVAILLLSKPAFALLRDYVDQRNQGKDPVFTKDRVALPGYVEFWNNEEEVVGARPAAR